MGIETRLVPAGDFTFTVAIAGPDDGVPVLMLHGFPQSRHAWTRQMEALAAEGFRCIAPDQRGYSPGARPQGTEHYAVQNIVGDALAIANALGAQRFHLVGHDWGGQIAWMTALTAPERILTLSVLSRPHPAAFARAWANDPDQPGRSSHHASLLKPETAAAIRAANLAPIASMFGGAGVLGATADDYIRVLSDPGALEAAIEWYRAAAGSLRAADVPSVPLPTMYVWGSADATVGRMAAEATGEFVTGPYTFVEIENAGHFLTDEVPDEVNRHLLAHLAKPR